MQAKLKKVLILFIMIQPLLDIYYWYVPPVSNLLPFAVPTIIRILLVFVLFVMFLRSYRLRDQKWWVYTYIAVLGIYFVLHVWNASFFQSVVPGNFKFSVVGELFYVVRMLLPLFTMFLFSKTDITEDNIGTVVKTLVASISGTIIVTNLTLISISSYSDHLIHGNFFNWFVNRQYFSFYDLASKGIFYFGNTTSGVLLLLTPVMWYYFLKKPNLWNAILMGILPLSMFMIGTKVATLGFVAASVLVLCFALFHHFVMKNFQFKKVHAISFAVVILLSLALYPSSPSFSRAATDDSVASVRESDEAIKKEQVKIAALEKSMEGKNASEQKILKEKFILKNYKKFHLIKRFVIKRYPYKYDPDFWYSVMKWPAQDRTNNRLIENAMLNRISTINNRKLDKLFGITYTRMNNLFNYERDFFSQSYSMGYIGMILLLGPYVACFLYAGVLWVLKKKYKTFLNSVLLSGVGIILIAAAYSGNIMDFLFATFILSFLEGSLLHFMGKIKKDTAPKHAAKALDSSTKSM